ncbi:MAG: flippase-like domain-containing protein [Clostridia bacterium]|nr:flippase-like domain-containing protein [Clostridia bacterium]
MEEEKIKEQPLQNKMDEAEQEFKLSKADNTAKELENRKSKTNKFGYFFLLLTVVVLVVIAVSEFNNNEEYPLSLVLSTWGQNWHYIVAAVCCVLLMLFLDGFRQASLLRGATGQWRIKLTSKSMILGRYFDNITPSAVGGQPYQIYYLHKHKVPAGVATSLPVVCFFMQQLAFFVLVVVCFCVFGTIVDNPWLQVAIYFGSLCMIAMPFSIMVFAFIPKTAQKLLHGIFNLLHKIKIVKNPEALKYKFDNYVNDYSKSLKLIGCHKKTLISGFVMALACWLLNFSTVYFIVLASGESLPWFYVIALMAYTNAASAFIPTPGGSGAMEGFFYLIVAVLDGGFRFWGMLLWRIITFYLPAMIGLGVLVNNTVKDKSYRRRGLFRTSEDDDDHGLIAKIKRKNKK